jgi:hypothetical protein
MRIRKPSPALVVSIVALVMATTGSAVAAIDFARNAGAVDHLSAVGASSSLTRAAGKLVATARGGSHKGKIPGKFLANVPISTTFENAFQVPDNANGAPVTLNATGFGPVTASCNDQNNKAGVEDPSTTVSFADGTSQTLNIASTVGSAAPDVATLAPTALHTVTINGSNTFEFQVELAHVVVEVKGQVRQDGRGTANGVCFIAGEVSTYTP